MSTPKASTPPKPSAAESRLSQEQANLARLQRNLLLEQQQRARELEAATLAQSGLERVFTGDPRVQARRAQLTAERARIQARKGASPKQKEKNTRRIEQINKSLQGLPADTYEIRETAAGRAEREEIERLQAKERAFQERRFTEEESLAPARTAAEQLQLAVQHQQLERQEKALKGELPVDEGLLRDLAKRESLTKESLLRQLGPGFETSTPGIEALREFETFRQQTLEQARRGDIAQLQGAVYNPTPGRGLARAPPSQPPGGGAYLGLQQPFLGAFGDVGASFARAAEPLRQQRLLESQFALSAPQGGLGSSFGRLFGTVLGGVAGTFLGGAGTALGAALGGQLGGSISGEAHDEDRLGQTHLWLKAAS